MNSGNEHWLIEQSQNAPGKVAIVASDRRLSYSELLQESMATAARLVEFGIRKDDNVGVLATHDHNFVVLLNAIWFMGAVPVPLNIKLTEVEIRKQLIAAGINSIVISDELSSKFALAEFTNKILFEKILSNKNNIQNSTFNPQKFDLSNNALIMFTSGSSGKQKAVVHTFGSLFNSVTALNDFAKLSRDDVWLASLSFYHVGGFMIPIRALLTGSTVAFPNSLGNDDVVNALEEFQPSHISLVPTTLQKMIEQNVRPNKNLKHLFLGGGPSENQLSLRAIEKGWPVVKVYGSTETCSMVSAMNSNEVNIKPGSSGKPLSNCKIKIVDEKQNNVPVGKAGEIVVQAGSIMKEYFGDVTETQKALYNGWYRTGDYGMIDNEGFLFIESRRDDLIITGGENVVAKEVQEIILQNKKVSDAFVFGIDDSIWGQMICAAVVSENLSEEELKTFMKLKVAGYKIPKRFYFVDNIPRNEMSKVDRKKLFEKINSR